MKKILSALILPLFFAGCYTSKIPIVKLNDTSVQKIDSRLAGNWVGDKVSKLKIIVFSNKEYLLAWSGKHDTTLAQAYSAKIKGQDFIIIRCLGNKPGTESYIFAKYLFFRSNMTELLKVEMVDKKLFAGKKFTSPEKLKEFIEQNINDPELYGTTYTFMKQTTANYSFILK